MGTFDAAPGPEPEAQDPEKKDLRKTEHEDRGVRVERNLGSEGHLARGNRTRMQSLNFSVKGRPAMEGERDPVFTGREDGTTAGRQAASARKDGAAEPVAPPPASASEAAATDRPPPDRPPAPGGLLASIKKLFGG